jgi:outer membrane protein TolC
VANPTIALAREAIRASEAERLQARALLLPTLDAGVSFDLHRGTLQSSRGIIREVNRQSLYAGAGVAAVGAGTVGFPGVRLTAHLADALFEPRATQQAVVARQFDALATRNTVLLAVTDAYLALAGAELRLQAIRQSERDVGVVAKQTAAFARTQEGRQGDADRARNQALLLRGIAVGIEEEVAVAAAELARLLNLDPSVRVRVPGGTVPLMGLIDPHARLEDLLEVALRNRPEVAARTADVAVNATRLRQERVRPFVPFVSAGFSAGEFGGGSAQTDTRFGHFNGRTDFDVLAVWSLQNFGAGNLAIQRRLRAQVREAVAERARVVDLIRREVAEAVALSATRLQELEVARRRVETAGEAFRLDMIRSRNLKGRPIEVLDSANLLTAARQDYIRALVGYGQAQFQLFVALGQPPTLAVPAAGTKPCP